MYVCVCVCMCVCVSGVWAHAELQELKCISFTVYYPDLSIYEMKRIPWKHLYFDPTHLDGHHPETGPLEDMVVEVLLRPLGLLWAGVRHTDTTETTHIVKPDINRVGPENSLKLWLRRQRQTRCSYIRRRGSGVYTTKLLTLSVSSGSVERTAWGTRTT